VALVAPSCRRPSSISTCTRRALGAGRAGPTICIHGGGVSVMSTRRGVSVIRNSTYVYTDMYTRRRRLLHVSFNSGMYMYTRRRRLLHVSFNSGMYMYTWRRRLLHVSFMSLSLSWRQGRAGPLGEGRAGPGPAMACSDAPSLHQGVGAPWSNVTRG
jgi:hypothetical protein